MRASTGSNLRGNRFSYGQDPIRLSMFRGIAKDFVKPSIGDVRLALTRSPLGKLENLRFLDLSATPVTDVSPLAQLEKLREVRLQGSAVQDFSPLDDRVLKGLTVGR